MIPLTTVFHQFNDEYGRRNFSNPVSIHEFINIQDSSQEFNYLALDRYFFSNLLKKSPYLLDNDTSQATLADFHEAERHAERYDELFYQLLEHDIMNKYLRKWRDNVHLILGKFEMGKLVVTSGATANCGTGNTPVARFSDTQISDKCKQWIARNQVEHLFPWDSTIPGVARLDFVPKTYKIGRAIVLPLAGNALLQKSIGESMKRRLKIQGIDLSTAQDVHKRLAKLASIKNHLVTDDQKWASSLIYKTLVRYLCPNDWVDVMDSCRDDVVELPDGSRHTMVQYASMGNGFCFELESIIYLALIRTAAYYSDVDLRSRDIRVFGDDLIYPVALRNLVRAIGRNVGFITNVDKSFSDGNFRESCGGDYYKGLNVRPVYLKGNFQDSYDVVTMCNQLYYVLDAHDWQLPTVHRTFKALIRHLYKLDIRNRNLWGPSNMAGCLHARPIENCRFSVNKLSNNQEFRTLIKVPVKRYSFREIAYKQDASFLCRMITGGLCKGLGYIVKPEQRLKPWIFGPPKPAKAEYPRTIPVPGTPYKTVVVDKPYYEYPPLVSVEDPLKIFDFLKTSSRCMPHIAADNYVECSEQLKVQLYTDLLGQLNERLRCLKVNNEDKFSNLLISFD